MGKKIRHSSGNTQRPNTPSPKDKWDRKKMSFVCRFYENFIEQLEWLALIENTTKTAIIEKCVMDYLDKNIDKLEKRKEKIFTKSNQYYDILEKRRRELFIEAKKTMDGGKNFS